MGKNLVRKKFELNDTWTCPAGVTRVMVSLVRDYIQVISGGPAALALTSLGDLYAWGNNGSCQLGDGTNISKSSPVLVVGGLKFCQVAGGLTGTIGLTVNGDSYTWGFNNNGQLGDNSVTTKSSPVAVVGNLKFRQVAFAGNANVAGALTVSGDCYLWGLNTNGQLGDGTVVAKSSPVLVVGGLKFKQLSIGGNHCAGLTQAGDIYCWGYNTEGQLGDGTTIAKSSPVLVVGGLKFKQVSVGDTNQTYGLTEGGDVYSWGSNAIYGSLGDGTTVDKSSPVLVIGGLKFKKLSAQNNTCLAITTSGDAFGWGNNSFGSIGDGTVVPKSSPVAVVGSLKFSDINRAYFNGSIGQTTAGDVYCWGRNESGQLGDGTVNIHKSSPVLVIGALNYQPAMSKLENSVSVDVTPGQSYPLTIFQKHVTFGNTQIGTSYGKYYLLLQYSA